MLHPVGYGFESNELPVLRRNSTFVARSKTPMQHLFYADNPLISGYMSDENRITRGSAGILVDPGGEMAPQFCL